MFIENPSCYIKKTNAFIGAERLAFLPCYKQYNPLGEKLEKV